MTVLPGPDVARTSWRRSAEAVVLNPGDFVPQGHLAMSEDTIVPAGLEELLSSRRWPGETAKPPTPH